MVFNHRKLSAQNGMNPINCSAQCKLVKPKCECPKYCLNDCSPYRPPRPPRTPQPVTNPDENHSDGGEKNVIETSLSITSSMIGGAFVLFLIYMVMRRWFTRRNNNSRERNLPIIFHTRDDFLDEDHGPVIDHHIWFINTVGLPRSIIDSITVCKYKAEEGLIEGTECSVCLSEFEEDENLRLLPKCSHAFHIPCIDTWLRSHKNCPLCRAPIVSDIAAAQVIVSEPRLNGSDPNEETQIENLDDNGGSASNEIGEETGEVREEDNNGENGRNPIKGLSDSGVENSNSRILSDLVAKREENEEEIQQPVRRSVSMDSSSAMMIYRDVANFVSDQGSSNSFRLVDVKKSLNSKRSGGNLSLYKLVNSSIGRSLQKGSVSMKRSSSSSRTRQFSPSKHFRSHSSILPG